MQGLRNLVEFLKPFKELVAIMVFLAGMGYAAFAYFATAQQLLDARAALEGRLERLQVTNKASLTEIKCLNELNRDLLRVQIEELSLRAVLQTNLEKAAKFKLMEGEIARVELANLEANRGEHIGRLTALTVRRNEILKALQDGQCSPQT